MDLGWGYVCCWVGYLPSLLAGWVCSVGVKAGMYVCRSGVGWGEVGLCFGRKIVLQVREGRPQNGTAVCKVETQRGELTDGRLTSTGNRI